MNTVGAKKYQNLSREGCYLQSNWELSLFIRIWSLASINFPNSFSSYFHLEKALEEMRAGTNCIQRHLKNNNYKKRTVGRPSKTTWQIVSLKGGGGYPPFPQRVFGQDDFPLRGGGVYPPIPLRKIPLKSRYFRFENSFFLPFFIHF